jgi:hypothetical protein
MRPSKPGFCALAVLALAGQLVAEQIVVTKAGTSLVGQVAFDGDVVVIKIEKAELRVPVSDVLTIATIASNGDGDALRPTQAQMLLMKALEARLLNADAGEATGILAEAARLAPDDARIAFWYASALVDAGQGRAASDVLNRHRAAISEAYPLKVGALVGRIERRTRLESLPPELLNRIDRLNVLAAAQPIAADDRQLFATFRLVDQDESPLPTDALRVECNGHDQHLDSFDAGHFLLTFKQSRSSEDGRCKLMISEPGYESRTYDVAASSTEVKDAGSFVVNKYDESARRLVRGHVVDSSGEPISGAQVRFYTQSPRSSSNDSLKASTDAQGVAEIRLYPQESVMCPTQN